MRHHRRWLLLLIAPLLLLTGCSMLTGSAATPGPGANGAAGQAGAANPWQVVARGSATPTPTVTSGVPPYPFPTATGFLPITGGGTRPTPSPTCAPDTVHFSQIKSLSVSAGPTSATVTWYNVGGYNLVGYRLTAISQDLKTGKQRDVGWKEIKPGAGCGTMTATISGLDRKTNYVLSLDAVVERRSGDGTHAGTLYRSPVVQTK
ncbi:fibronectin type III domain-containing protein [Actinoplanes sp. TFC3]|uniref:fibronectin type III domain-containing protein n=1 Tax=Actinoplanes sp. TFC3 TaxID=1710355 RepID=UPI00083265F6|nr:fibronectin type III domain-containing protein [Actinoplanes sp. TFC3]